MGCGRVTGARAGCGRCVSHGRRFERGSSRAAAAGHGGGGSGRARVEAGRRPPGACLLASADTAAALYGICVHVYEYVHVHMHILIHIPQSPHAYSRHDDRTDRYRYLGPSLATRPRRTHQPNRRCRGLMGGTCMGRNPQTSRLPSASAGRRYHPSTYTRMHVQCAGASGVCLSVCLSTGSVR